MNWRANDNSKMEVSGMTRTKFDDINYSTEYEETTEGEETWVSYVLGSEDSAISSLIEEQSQWVHTLD